MAGLFVFLALIFYVGYLIDWKELRAVSSQGGWATIVILVVLTAVVVNVISTPTAVSAAGMG
jgi:uncharacterized MAPEG superfamily protein